MKVHILYRYRRRLAISLNFGVRLVDSLNV